MMLEAGGQFGVRIQASGEEFVSCLIPSGAGLDGKLWKVAERFASAKLGAFASHLGALNPAVDFGTLHAMTRSKVRGSGQTCEERKEQLDALNLRVPVDMPRQLALAAHHLAAGYAIHQSHPDHISVRPSRLATLNVVGDAAFELARKWAR